MNSRQDRSVSIRQLPDEIRPRERLRRLGVGVLSDTELIAILLGNGHKGTNVLDLARNVLVAVDGLAGLARAASSELVGTPGLGEAKTCRLLAAAELGKRLAMAEPARRIRLSDADTVADYLMPRMRYLDKEHFSAVIVNTKNQVLKVLDIAVGSLSQAIVHPRELFKEAIKAGAAGLIVAHNHPSGDPYPSQGDVELTSRLRKIGDLLGIELIDHIVIGDGSYVSFKRQNWFLGSTLAGAGRVVR